MNRELDNRMVINGGSNGPDWNDDDADEPELTKEESLEATVERLEANARRAQFRIDELTARLRDLQQTEAQRRIKELETGISDFVHALDRGFFGSDLKSVDLSDSAFVDALRNLAAKSWSGR